MKSGSCCTILVLQNTTVSSKLNSYENWDSLHNVRVAEDDGVVQVTTPLSWVFARSSALVHSVPLGDNDPEYDSIVQVTTLLSQVFARSIALDHSVQLCGNNRSQIRLPAALVRSGCFSASDCAGSQRLVHSIQSGAMNLSLYR